MTNLEHQSKIQSMADDLLDAIRSSDVFINWIKKNAQVLSESAEHEMTGASYRIVLLPTSLGTSVSVGFGNCYEDMIPEVNDLI